MRTILCFMLMPVLAGVFAGCEQNGMTTGESSPDQRYVYTVQSDDTNLRDVAEKVYGNGDMWTHIADANPGVEGEDLQEGDQLAIPVLQSEDGEMIEPSGCDRQEIYY